MAPLGVVLVILAVIFAYPAPVVLRKYTTLAEPGVLLILWQAVGLAGGLSLIGASLALALAPVVEAYSSTGRLTLRWYTWIILAGALVIFFRLIFALLHNIVTTCRWRKSHSNLVALLTTPSNSLPQARILQSDQPIAYCIPHRAKPMTVMSTGLLKTLNEAEQKAVLAHELAHSNLRHDILLLPFAAWQQALPFIPASISAKAAVTALIEFMADDHARAHVSASILAAAVAKAHAAGAPGTEQLTHHRIKRLQKPLARGSTGTRILAAVLSALLLSAPIVLVVIAVHALLHAP